MNHIATNSTPLSVDRFLERFGCQPLTFRPSQSVVDAAEHFSDDVDGRKHSLGVVIGDDGGVVGVLSLGDIASALGRFQANVVAQTVGDIMTTNVATASRSEKVASVMERMAQLEIRHMPVVENGKLKGLITRKDALESLYNDATFELKYITEFVFRSGARY